MAVTVLGFMAFQAAAFYLAFFMQELRAWSAIIIAVHLLPQALAGLLWNVIVGNILHRVNNTILMAAGALAYLVADILLSLMSADSNYWAFIFPALILNVVGADFQFNVANVSFSRTLFCIFGCPFCENGRKHEREKKAKTTHQQKTKDKTKKRELSPTNAFFL